MLWVPRDLRPDDRVITIEGLADTVDMDLHPRQRAWLDRDVAQCGYCRPGQMTDADLDDIRNICRCGTYPRIRDAIVHGERHI